MGNEEFLNRLEGVIRERRGESPDSSYVAALLQGDHDSLLKKIGEESMEVILATKSDKTDQVVEESADLLFHLMVLLVKQGLSLDAVVDTLKSRFGTSGLVEKALRSDGNSR